MTQFVFSWDLCKQRQPYSLKARVVLGGEGITYSIILHSDTISEAICKNHLNVEPIKISAFGLYYPALYDDNFPKPLFLYKDK